MLQYIFNISHLHRYYHFPLCISQHEYVQLVYIILSMFSRIIIQLNTIRSYVIHVQYRVTHSYWRHFRQDHRLILVWDISANMVMVEYYWVKEYGWSVWSLPLRLLWLGNVTRLPWELRGWHEEMMGAGVERLTLYTYVYIASCGCHVIELNMNVVKVSVLVNVMLVWWSIALKHHSHL